MNDKINQPNQSVEKVLKLIEFLAQSEQPLPLKEIAASVKMPESTTMRLLKTLYTCGYVNQDPVSYRYSLSLKFTWIGALVRSHISISGLSEKLLMEMSRKCDESTNIAVVEDNQIVYIAAFDRPGTVLHEDHLRLQPRRVRREGGSDEREDHGAVCRQRADP